MRGLLALSLAPLRLLRFPEPVLSYLFMCLYVFPCLADADGPLHAIGTSQTADALPLSVLTRSRLPHSPLVQMLFSIVNNGEVAEFSAVPRFHPCALVQARRHHRRLLWAGTRLASGPRLTHLCWNTLTSDCATICRSAESGSCQSGSRSPSPFKPSKFVRRRVHASRFSPV